jgi:hypothetical protein
VQLLFEIGRVASTGLGLKLGKDDLPRRQRTKVAVRAGLIALIPDRRIRNVRRFTRLFSLEDAPLIFLQEPL